MEPWQLTEIYTRGEHGCGLKEELLVRGLAWATVEDSVLGPPILRGRSQRCRGWTLTQPRCPITHEIGLAEWLIGWSKCGTKLDSECNWVVGRRGADTRAAVFVCCRMALPNHCAALLLLRSSLSSLPSRTARSDSSASLFDISRSQCSSLPTCSLSSTSPFQISTSWKWGSDGVR
jgi:hypothetical protein